MKEDNLFVKQHPNDGDKLVNLKFVQIVDMSDDSYHAKVLMSDGEWIRVYKTPEEIKKCLF